MKKFMLNQAKSAKEDECTNIYLSRTRQQEVVWTVRCLERTEKGSEGEWWF